MTINHDTINGLEASRRVGWAKYFQAQDTIQDLISLIEQLSDLVIYHDRLPSSDPVIVKAIEIRREAWNLAA